MKQVKTHAFRGKRYQVKHSNALRIAGDLGRSNYEKKAVYIPHDGDTKDELDTIIHEALHLAFPFLTEDAEPTRSRGCCGGWSGARTCREILLKAVS